MDASQLPELRRTTLKVVRKASRPGGPLEQGEFTMAIARQQISQSMGLGSEGLEDKEWKAQVKELVQAGLQQVAEEQNEESPVKQQKADGVGSSKRGGGRKSKARSKVEEEDEEEDVEEDEEQEEEEEKNSASDSESSFIAATNRGRTSSGKSKSTISKGQAKSTANTAKRRRRGAETESEHSATEEEKEDDRQQSESEMSSVYDVPPSRKRSKKQPSTSSEPLKGGEKRKSKAADSDDDTPRPSSKGKRKKKDLNEGLSAEEAKIADLKRVVVACGVRKQWSKEFAHCETSRQQLSKLEQILRSLGMHGQPSIGKAKALKEKRELEAELNDVREFEAARGISGGRAKRNTKSQIKMISDEEEEESGGEDEGPKETSALDAVMNFLGEESESD